MREDEVVERLHGQLLHSQDFDDLVDADGLFQRLTTNVVERGVDDVITSPELREEDSIASCHGPDEADLLEVLPEQNQEPDQLSSHERKPDDDQVIA